MSKLSKRAESNQDKISLTLEDLKNHTYFGNWIAKHFGDEISLKNIDPQNIKTAIDVIVRSEQFRLMSKEDRSAFNNAFNGLIPRLEAIPKMRQDD